MDKKSLILKHFQKKHLLNTSNSNYQSLLSELFLWLLKSDEAKFDITSEKLALSKSQEAHIICKQNAILAGMEELSYLLNFNTKVNFLPLKKDGDEIKKNDIIATISGKSNEILRLERTILNIVQRMSGISTYTSSLISLIKNISQKPYLAATRKTPWGLLDKKAVSLGGGLTHRISLKDGVLIKDNHLELVKKSHQLKTIKEAIKKSLELVEKKSKYQMIEIEVENKNQAIFAFETYQKLNSKNFLTLMLDNFSPSQISSLMSDLNIGSLPIIFEASGGITKDNISDFANLGVDFISLGSLTHSAKSCDFSLEIS